MSGEMRIKLQVFGPSGERKILDLCDNEEQLQKITVQQLKERIVKELRIEEDFHLVFGTEVLDESALLVSYGIRHMSNIYTIIRLLGV